MPAAAMLAKTMNFALVLTRFALNILRTSSLRKNEGFRGVNLRDEGG